MKRLIISIMCFFLLSVITFTENVTATDDKLTKETYTIAFNNKSLSFEFFVALQEIGRVYCEERGWTYRTTNANFDSTLQFDQLANLAQEGVDYIITATVDSEGLIGAVEKANKLGIPVAAVDSLVMGGDVKVSVAYDNYMGGYMAAEKIVELLTKKYGKPKGKVLNCYGAMESMAWRLRKKAMDACFAEYPDIQYFPRPTEGLVNQTYNVARDFLSEHPDVDAMHHPSETPGQGMLVALADKGKLHPVGHPDHVIIVTIDGEPRALDWIREGYLDASISQDPLSYTEIALEMFEKYISKGKAVPLGTYENPDYYWGKAQIVKGVTGPEIVEPPYYITKDNVDDPRHWGNRAVKLGILKRPVMPWGKITKKDSSD